MIHHQPVEEVRLWVVVILLVEAGPLGSKKMQNVWGQERKEVKTCLWHPEVMAVPCPGGVLGPSPSSYYCRQTLVKNETLQLGFCSLLPEFNQRVLQPQGRKRRFDFHDAEDRNEHRSPTSARLLRPLSSFRNGMGRDTSPTTTTSSSNDCLERGFWF